ncbi:unnamed protein product [Peronospora belbahrii]|uniref:Uncharacterized protein n=1 Tax=Peronospora belbahrii TaxID=622444 RepID=A0AAU9L3M0_9STRA|nr:unnamed protein product [Peronospora belbahrii]CAH0516403.1 unnamed protein product [Peronospora belbahrii]
MSSKMRWRLISTRRKYCKKVLERFGFGEAHGSATPMETNARFSKRIEPPQDDCIDFGYQGAIGSFMYLATSTWPDIFYAVGYLRRFVSNPSRKHLEQPSKWCSTCLVHVRTASDSQKTWSQKKMLSVLDIVMVIKVMIPTQEKV